MKAEAGADLTYLEQLRRDWGPEQPQLPDGACRLYAWRPADPVSGPRARTPSRSRRRDPPAIEARPARDTARYILWLESANAIVRSERTYLASRYARIKGRRGHKKAVGAVAHSILVIAYHVLQRRRPYADLGPDYLLRRDNAEAYTKRLVRQLERLGHKVSLEPSPMTA